MAGQGAEGPTASADRFTKMLRWYPASWRGRYGDEMLALLEDTHRMRAPSLRERLSLVKSGSIERARAAGLTGASTGPEERLRAGSLLILCAWAFFMMAGGIFAKFTEHWDVTTPRTHRWLPGAGSAFVQGAGIGGMCLVVVATLVVLPDVLRFVRRDGWASIRSSLLCSALAAVTAIATTVGIVLWAHHLTSPQRNGGAPSFHLLVVVWLLTIAAAIALGTAAAVRVARRILLSPRKLRLLGGMALALVLLMALVMAGTLVWWGAMASYAPGFLGNGPLARSNLLPPPLLIAGVLMCVGLALAALGAARVTPSLRLVPRR